MFISYERLDGLCREITRHGGDVETACRLKSIDIVDLQRSRRNDRTRLRGRTLDEWVRLAISDGVEVIESRLRRRALEGEEKVWVDGRGERRVSHVYDHKAIELALKAALPERYGSKQVDIPINIVQYVREVQMATPEDLRRRMVERGLDKFLAVGEGKVDS